MKHGMLAASSVLGLPMTAGAAHAATVIDFTGNEVTYDVTQSGVYDITAYGAQGGDGYEGGVGGQGAEIGGDITLTKGETLTILVGGFGGPAPGGGGGGGGSFVVGPGDTPLLVAGGGGGAGDVVNGGSGLTTTFGGAGAGVGGGAGGIGGAGGFGASGLAGFGGGGGGFADAGGATSYGQGGASFLGGGAGGSNGLEIRGGGGFGGGGGAGEVYGGAGGGGGYSGGGGGSDGGGGGSFFDGTPLVSVPGENSGAGAIDISFVGAATVPGPYVWLGNGDNTVSYAASTAAVEVDGAGGNDTITGSKYNDTINGGAGDDRLHGGAGNDVITGGPGADMIEGGPGNDTFVFNAGDLVGGGGRFDQIIDFHGAGTTGVGEQDFLRFQGFDPGTQLVFQDYYGSQSAQVYKVLDPTNPTHDGLILVQMADGTNQLTAADYHFY
jgi:Ca2+-binding RTX toxin-like protein